MLKFIVENWSQITVLLAMLGYIIKSLLEFRIKKKEITFMKVQEMKLSETKMFFLGYQSFSISLEQFMNQIFYGSHSKPMFDKNRAKISDSHIDFEYRCMTLKLFLKDDDIKIIDDISIILKTIKVDIENCLIHLDKEVNSEHWDKLKGIRSEKLRKELPELIKKIETSFRESYNVV